MITEQDLALQERVKEFVRGLQGPRMVLTRLVTEADAVWQLQRSPTHDNPYVTVTMSKVRAPQERTFVVVDLSKIQE